MRDLENVTDYDTIEQAIEGSVRRVAEMKEKGEYTIFRQGSCCQECLIWNGNSTFCECGRERVEWEAYEWNGKFRFGAC